MTDEALIAWLRSLKGLGWSNEAADRIESLIAERKAHEKEVVVWSENYAALERKLAENEVRLGKAVEALSPLSAIADAYDENELDDEARKLWGKNLEHENRTPFDEIEIFAGRGGKRLLTLGDAMKARAALAELKGETK